MARPLHLDLTATDLPWRTVPMVGAELGLDVVPLTSHPDDFVILARFPVGFSRPGAGGYHAAETFVVLDGELTVNGRQVVRGDLTHIPAEAVRTGMHTADGCLALAWFSGPATFLPVEELGECDREVTTVRVPTDASATTLLLDTPEAVWSIAPAGTGETVDLGLTLWQWDAEAAGPALVRSRR